jgi:hypothetical protein
MPAGVDSKWRYKFFEKYGRLSIIAYLVCGTVIAIIEIFR